jgi:hypothetical protein
MDVLLGWSRERSRLMALELHRWLPQVLPAIKPWMSELDIDKGKDWSDALHGFLAEAKAVVVSITPENVRSPWLYYECGQIAARTETNLICPYLLEDEHSILADGPLARTQQTKAQKEDTFRLMKSLNKSLGSRAIDEGTLGGSFEREWIGLSGTLDRIRQMEVKGPNAAAFIATDADRLAGTNLSEEAREMILEIGKDQRGLILTSSTNMGQHFQTNGKNLNTKYDARGTAKLRSALKSLIRCQLLEMMGSKGEVYQLTDKGYEVFDLLTIQSSQS